ncbi:LuxR C-terminal-related transcriptional regulator [Microvirga sp. TS319]|uniref:LuxR C-terminal-related transcriptional regulator n=1 Tax=Microvirga sp. TS319 TaxID=3241165 RepID=UPI00351A35EB
MTSQIAKMRLLRAAPEPTVVPTVILCENSIVRLGFAHLLSNTCFQVVDVEVAKDVQPLPFEDASTALIIVSAGSDVCEAAKTVEQLRREASSAKVVVIADSVDVASITRMYRAGVDGLLLSTTRHEALIKALEMIMMGERLFPSTALLDVTQEIEQQQMRLTDRPEASQDDSTPAVLRALSEREKEVLSRLTKGAQDKVIARDLNLAEATVKVYVKSLLKKLGAQNRTQAAVIASSYIA